MLSCEGKPYTDRARRVDLQHSIPLDVAELPRRCVIEGEDDWRQAVGQVDPAVDHLRHRHRPVPALVENLEVAAEGRWAALPPAIGLADQMILEHRNAADFVRHACTRGGVVRRRLDDRGCALRGRTFGGDIDDWSLT